MDVKRITPSAPTCQCARSGSGSASIRWIAVITVALLSGIAIWMNFRSARPENPQAALFETPAETSVPATPAPSGPSLADLEAWLVAGQSSWSEDDLIRTILALDERTREKFLYGLADAFRADPGKLFAFVERLATAWAQSDPGPATLFLSNLHGQPGIIPLERRLMNDWVERDFQSVGQYFQEVDREKTVIPVTQMAFLTAICQSEQKESFNDLLQWVDGLKGSENGDLRSTAYEALVKLGQPENFPKIADLLGRNVGDPTADASAAALMVQQAKEHPDDVLKWLEDLPREFRQRDMVQDVFRSLGQHHPEMAVNIINDQALMQKLFGSGKQDVPPPPGAVGNERQWLQDRALSQFLEGMIASENPDYQYLLACAKTFTDPRLKEKYAKIAANNLQLRQPGHPDHSSD